MTSDQYNVASTLQLFSAHTVGCKRLAKGGPSHGCVHVGGSFIQILMLLPYAPESSAIFAHCNFYRVISYQKVLSFVWEVLVLFHQFKVIALRTSNCFSYPLVKMTSLDSYILSQILYNGV